MRGSVVRSFVGCAALVALVSSASEVRAESPRSMMLEIRIGPYSPEVDDGFASGAGTPWASAFGDSPMWTLGLYWDYQFYQDVGSLAIGAGVAYGWVDGTAVEADSADETGFNIVPFTAGVTYRFDYLAIEYSVPVVIYLKVGLEWAIWWATNGKNQISNTWSRDEPYEPRLGRSNTFGFYFGGGIQLLLDFMYPSMAVEFDAETGVNNSYLFFEVLRHELNDFYSSDSINLSETALTFGLMLEF